MNQRRPGRGDQVNRKGGEFRKPLCERPEIYVFHRVSKQWPEIVERTLMGIGAKGVLKINAYAEFREDTDEMMLD